MEEGYHWQTACALPWSEVCLAINSCCLLSTWTVPWVSTVRDDVLCRCLTTSLLVALVPWGWKYLCRLEVAINHGSPCSKMFLGTNFCGFRFSHAGIRLQKKNMKTSTPKISHYMVLCTLKHAHQWSPCGLLGVFSITLSSIPAPRTA